MAEINDRRDIKDTKTKDDLDNLRDRAIDDSTELKQDIPFETKDDSKETNKEVEDMDKHTLQANSNTREMFEKGNEELASLFQELAVRTRPDGLTFLEDLPLSMKIAMQPIFSRDIYHASMKEIVGKYSAWLEEHKDSLSSEQYDNYCKQLEVMRKFVEELDAVSESDSKKVKNQRLKSIVGYTQQLLQSLGQFPAELENVIFEDIPPSTQSIMQSFLSKDILYPPMKEFFGTYSVWLEEHKDSLSSEQYDNYCKHLEIVRKFVEEFEAESESDSEEVKKQRLQRIVGYMQQMQSFLPTNISYPTMKEFVGKISMWLEEHKDSLSSEQYDNYCKQLEVTRKNIQEFEAESESENEEVRKQRLQWIVQQMKLWADLFTGDSSADCVTPAFTPGMASN